MDKLSKTGKCLNCGDSVAGQSFCSRKCYLTMKWDSNSPLYKIWTGMKYRCLDETCKDFARYGGRGIKICTAWMVFKNFEAWALSHGFKPGLELERINNSEGYNPGNCKFANDKQQARNRRNNTLLTAFGETKPISAWEEDPRCVVNRYTLAARVTRQKLPHQVAITHPLQPKKKNGKRDPIVGSVKHFSR